MKNTETKDFVAYEYLTIQVPNEKEALYIDCYENFGWQLTKSTSYNGLIDREDYYINHSNVEVNRKIQLKFKRDRKIPNKAKVVSLQKRCENGLKELSRLEKEPAHKASIYAVIIALIGTILLAISVFLITATDPINLLGMIPGMFGLGIWFVTYPIYKKVKLKQEEINISFIEEKYSIIYDACEQAQKSLN